MSETTEQEPHLTDDHIVVGAMIEGLRDCPHYTYADAVAGLMVVESDKDEQGHVYGYLVIGDKAVEVTLDLSRLSEESHIVAFPVATPQAEAA
jgi:hypothetical protein